MTRSGATINLQTTLQNTPFAALGQEIEQRKAQNQAMPGYYYELDLNYEPDRAILDNLPQEAAGYIYLVENRDGQGNLKILKVGSTADKPKDRVKEYLTWANYQTHVTLHIFRISQFPQALLDQLYQAAANAKRTRLSYIESQMREPLYNNNAGLPLPEDHEASDSWRMASDRLNTQKYTVMPKLPPVVIPGL